MPIKPIQQSQKQPHNNISIWQMSVSDIIFRNRKRKAPIKDLALFCRKLTYLLAAGLPIKAALPTLQGKSLGSVLGSVIPLVHKRVIKGDSFSDALKLEGVFPEFMVGYIAIGEKTGQLAIVCAKLADYYEQQAKTRRELFAALMYPIAVLIMMFGVIILAMVTVLPGYARIFEASNVALPVMTAMLLDISAFLTENILLLAGGFLIMFITGVIFIGSKHGKRLISGVELKIPILRQAVNLHLTQALSLLLASGVRLSEAVLLCMNLTGNVRVKRDLRELSKHLSAGLGFSDSLESIPYIDPLMQDLARVGEKTGDLTQSMERCLDYFVADYKHNIARVNKLIEPIITLVMGILIALVMLAVVLPTFELAAVM